MTFYLQIAGTIAVLLLVFVGIPVAWRATGRWADRRVQQEIAKADAMPLPWEPMSAVDPDSWDAHCATALWAARQDDTGSIDAGRAVAWGCVAALALVCGFATAIAGGWHW